MNITHCAIKGKMLGITQKIDTSDAIKEICREDDFRDIIREHKLEYDILYQLCSSKEHNAAAVLLFAISALDRCGCSKKSVKEPILIVTPKGKDIELLMNALRMFALLGNLKNEDLIDRHSVSLHEQEQSYYSFLEALLWFDTLPHPSCAYFLYDMDTLFPDLSMEEAEEIYIKSGITIPVVAIWIVRPSA